VPALKKGVEALLKFADAEVILWLHCISSMLFWLHRLLVSVTIHSDVWKVFAQGIVTMCNRAKKGDWDQPAHSEACLVFEHLIQMLCQIVIQNASGCVTAALSF
jgi:hypothetical protein